MNLWTSAVGIVEADLVSGDPGGILSAMAAEGIKLAHVRYLDDLTVRIQVTPKAWEAVKKLSEKRGVSAKLVKRGGLYWKVCSFLHRPVLLCGLCFLLILMMFLPGRILFLQVSGNEKIPSRQILEAAESCGLRFFASRGEIRSEQVKNALLEAIPQLQWAGVTTRGCVANISVRERPAPSTHQEKYTVSSIVAARDGVIDSCTASEGNLLCKPGDAVKKSQLLISGYTDCGTHLKAVKAEGEVYAMTKRQIQAVSPLQSLSRGELQWKKSSVSLILGKKRINLWKGSGICPATCGRMYEEYYITLPGGFQLPVALAVERVYSWETGLSTGPERELSAFAREYLLSQMIAGEIFSGSEETLVDNGLCSFSGSYVCREMIGREKQEQMGEVYVQNN